MEILVASKGQLSFSQRVLTHRSGYENNCRPTPGIPLLFDFLYQEDILIQATAELQDNLFHAISIDALQRPSPGYCLSTEQISGIQSMRHFTSKDIILPYNRFNPRHLDGLWRFMLLQARVVAIAED